MYSILFFSALLASVVVKDIDCLPIGATISKAVPLVKQWQGLKKAYGDGRSLSSAASYRGPVVPETEKEAIAIIDNKAHHSTVVARLRETGAYSKVSAVLSGANSKGAGMIHDHQAKMTKTKWQNADESFLQSRLNVFKGGDHSKVATVAAPHEGQGPIERHLDDLHKHFHPETTKVDVYHLAHANEHEVGKVYRGINKGGKEIGVAMDLTANQGHHAFNSVIPPSFDSKTTR